ncbi:hypothetical protein [Pontibacter sp. SGAir0037]|uniref:hypothetical protein n=1 Tax=Pontibacter sp. SGAir0037 TaxID=2571030 RepID=UPI0010CCD8E8|nr:hypothetical protein [Pontibacter sp. SGAir0037]QCR23740.1 hypothetical protein C1N53_16230 [Pontibacter sp. SGAir0037]
MMEREENRGRPGAKNQQIGKELYNQDRRNNEDNGQGQSRYGYRGNPSQRDWDEGNFFHTGPSNRGAQDQRHPRDYDREHYRGGSSNSSYQQGQNAHLNDHYGSRSDSPYRNERSYLNHGDRGHNQNQYMHGNAGGSQPGNYNELPSSPDKLHREGPGTRSRYKESDYRYGSGSHNWYRENRYSPDEERESRDDRGFFDKVRDGWNDIMHSDDPDYQPRNRGNERQAEELSSRKRYGGEQYRDRNYNNGYEGGPRWADETDSGDDDYYNNSDRNQRYRR